MPEPQPPVVRYTFLQCVVIFWYLMHRVVEHDGWLRRNLVRGRASGPQYEADDFKGWFFWMYLSGLNSNEMQRCFNLQGWWGYSRNSRDYWFKEKLVAWGWPMATRKEKEIRDNFIKFLRDVVPDEEFRLHRDDPKIAQYIMVDGWKPLPATKHPYKGGFAELERQALVLCNNEQQPLPLTILVDSYGQASNPSTGPPASGHGHFGTPPVPESPGFANVRTPHPRAPNPPSLSPQFARNEMQANEASMAINHSDRPLVISPDTDHRPIATNLVARGGPPASRHKPPTAASKNLNSTEVPATPRGASKRKVQSANSYHSSPRSEYHHAHSQCNTPELPESVAPLYRASQGQHPMSSFARAGRQHNAGLSMQTASGTERAFPSTPQSGTNLLSQPAMGVNNNVVHPPRGSAIMTSIGHREPQALGTPPSHPQGQATPPRPNHRRRQDGSPATADPKLPLPSLPQVDGSQRAALPPKRRWVEAFSPASITSGSATSPSAGSPQSSFISQASSTPSQAWSADSSPLPNNSFDVPAQEVSSPGIVQGKGTGVLDRPSLMSPSSVVQAVNARLSLEQVESPLERVSRSGRRATASSEGLSRRALTYAEEGAGGAGASAGGPANEAAVESDVSSPETSGGDESGWMDAESYNDKYYEIAGYRDA